MRVSLFAKRAAVIGAATIALATALSGNANALARDGEDPIASGCAADARTVRSVPLTNGSAFTYGTMELRYSPYCRTTWARVWSDGDDLFARVVRDQGGYFQDCSTPTWNSGAGRYTCFTRMVNDAGFTSHAWGWASNSSGYASYTAQTASY
ncbi:DUF2690 domain-containing protein [Kitasatospora camelliae]|uniref:DUF2690 domain-containing protein n=1 Tax=Kitasatospora camelliae TaxID=3156397 RepID=A0AAU8K5L6_9ACTN